VPRVKITIESPIAPSFRVAQVAGMFDVPLAGKLTHDWDVNLPIEGLDWQIGLLVGPSGSGKTTLGRRLFPDARFHEGYAWPAAAAIVDAFPEALDGKTITGALSSVGFSSPPHWLKRYAHLSNGQKFRCELARLMLDTPPLADTGGSPPVVVFDEFTSVVDRDAAKVSSAAVAKALRRRGTPRLVALSCHYDVIDWLDPDWVYNVADGSFARRSLRRRPAIELAIHEASPRAWPLFSGHHYLSRTLHRSARCFVACWGERPVAFTSYLHLPGKDKRLKREHRTVVLPDYQGVGIGNALSEWLGGHVKGLGFRFVSTTSHPAMIRHRMKSPLWKSSGPIGHKPGHVGASKRAGGMKEAQSRLRITGSFEYVGPARLAPQRGELNGPKLMTPSRTA